MATLQYTRREVNSDDILRQTARGEKTIENAAKELGISVEEVKKQIDGMMTKRKDRRGYSGKVQKMISFRGTVSAMTVMANSRKGGKYPLRVINLYMKPGTERYYEENFVNPINKSIGNETNKTTGGTTQSAGVETPIPDGTIVIERKKGKSFVSIVLRRKPVSRKSMRKCVHKRK